MAISNHERVGKAMELLEQGLAPFIERELENVYKDEARPEISRLARESGTRRAEQTTMFGQE